MRALQMLSCLMLSFCLSNGLALAQSLPANLPAVEPLGQLELPKPVERTLSNGLQVVVIERPNVPKVTMVLGLRSGDSSDPPGQTGLADLTAAVLEEGTAKSNSVEIQRRLQAIGGNFSATADTDFTLILASSLAGGANQLAELVGEIVTSPTFPAEEVTLARQNAIQALRVNEAQPAFVAQRALSDLLYGSHPYSRFAPTVTSLQGLDRKKLSDFHRTYYRPNEAVLVVVGAVRAEAMLAQLTKVFETWQRSPVPEPDYATIPKSKDRRIYLLNRPGSVQSTILIGRTSIRRLDKEYFPFLVTNALFGGAFNSRLITNIRERRGYTYSPNSVNITRLEPGRFQVQADVRNEVTGASLLEIFYELDRLAVEPVGKAELESTQSYLCGNFAIQLRTQQGLANQLATVYLYRLPKDYLSTYCNRVRAVTPADIQQVARLYLNSSRDTVVIVGDAERVREQLTAFGQVEAYAPVAAPAAAAGK